jgi:hypothetical protein
MNYIYIYTADENKFDRIKIGVEYAKTLDEAVFCVNDLEAISKVREYGYKAMNLDALVDLFNLLTPDDTIAICTPEDATILKASYRVKDLCDGRE